MRKLFCLAIGSTLALLPAAAAAQSMNADAFYVEAVALKKKGPMALMSMGRVKALMREAEAAGKNARAERMAIVAAGGKPRYCPPAGRSSMDSSEFMRHLEAIPAAERKRIDMTEVMVRIFSKKYPC